MPAVINEGPVLLDLDDTGVARLTLNRPKASNALNLECLSALHTAVMRCHADPDVRVVVISGAGKNFCAGGDVREFASRGEELPVYTREVGAWLQVCASALVNLRAPVISAVHGFAAGGGGLGLVCASDIVVAARSARFMSGAVRVGMAPDAGTTVTLTQLVGLRKAMHILLANPTITATEAADIGLVTLVTGDENLRKEVDELASNLAASAPLGLAATKHLVWQGVGNSVDAQMPVEARIVSQLSGTADSREGLAAVLGRRPPRFTGR